MFGLLLTAGLLGGLGVVVAVAITSHLRREPPVTVQSDPPVADLTELMRKDPAFSLPMFEAFVFELIAEVYRRRDPALAGLERYLKPTVLDCLTDRKTQAVLIGALRVQDHSVISEDRDQLSVETEATLLGPSPTQIVEMWKFVRAPGVLTPKPAEAPQTSPCESCGSVSSTNRPTCAHCHAPIPTTFTWQIDRMWIINETTVRASLTGTVPEQGTHLRTVVDPAATATLSLLTWSDPEVTWPALEARIGRIYRELNTAWNANDLAPVRGLVTAALRDYLGYWLRAYESQQLRNQLTRAELTKIELAKVTRDAYYDAVTVRIFATGYDYTLDKQGAVVGGSNNQYRPYSEYWTFLRSAARTGKVHDTTACPNCGAPQAISDAGACTHCDAVIENGAFDWVLSKIEQDDSYAG